MDLIGDMSILLALRMIAEMLLREPEARSAEIVRILTSNTCARINERILSWLDWRIQAEITGQVGLGAGTNLGRKPSRV